MKPGRKKGSPDERVVDASPGDEGDVRNQMPGSPAELFNQTRTAGMSGIARGWKNYKKFLADSFKAMDRDQQETLIGNLCMIITLGITGLALLLFYPMINRALRIVLVPGALAVAWWLSNNVVRAVILDRLAPFLNDPVDDTFADTVEEEYEQSERER